MINNVDIIYRRNILFSCFAVLIACWFMLSSSVSQAGTLEAKITFDKKPAKAGVIYIPGSGAAGDDSLNQKDKEFSRKMTIVTPGSTLKFLNSDSVDHNIFVNDLTHGVSFDVGLMPTGSEIDHKVDWKSGSVVRIGCKIHPKMKAYIANIEAQAYQPLEFEKGVTEYIYTIDGLKLKDNKTTVRVHLVKYDPLEIELDKGGVFEGDLVRKGKKKGRISLTIK